jgi:hypothetical protein
MTFVQKIRTFNIDEIDAWKLVFKDSQTIKITREKKVQIAIKERNRDRQKLYLRKMCC